MEIVLYNSTVCRLCGEENDNGTLLYSSEENTQNLSELINEYLPIKIYDDGELPRTICPGCTIQLEATIEFLNLIINGQKVIRELHQRQIDYKRNQIIDLNNTDFNISESVFNGSYSLEHAMTLRVAGLDKPKRKRGRPSKKDKPPEEAPAPEIARVPETVDSKVDLSEELNGKRRRKTPKRFKEVIQGKELERIFLEEGVIDGNESDDNTKQESKPDVALSIPKEPEVIGHLENSGELVVVVKGKGRGRPKGRHRQTRSQCGECGLEFSCAGRYMSHVAGHSTHRAKESENKKVEKIEPDEPLPAENDIDENIPKSLPELDPMKVEMELNITSQTIDNVVTISNDTPKVNGNDVEPLGLETAEELNEEDAQEQNKGKRKLKCNHCPKMFNSKQSKSLHIKAVHGGETPYRCAVCGAQFAYPRSLALHALAHRRRAHPAGFGCDLCGKVLNHPSSVMYHKEAEHAGQRYVCNKCGKSFKHKQLLQRHQLVHSQLRPYTCKVCNASFKTKANLVKHLPLHSGVKKFSCDICKHRFAHKTSLTLHMRWHTGHKPFVCGSCGKRFSQKGNLSEHERIHTGERPFECGVCRRRFTTSSQHRQHARRHLAHLAHPARIPDQMQNLDEQMAAEGVDSTHHQITVSAESADGVAAVEKRGRRSALRRHTRTHTDTYRKQPQKQISLLMNEQIAPTEEEERVIYVTYDVEDGAPSYRLLAPSPPCVEPQCEEEVSAGGASLLLAHPPPAHTMPVTDEEGNPLLFTMEDGTQLAITLVDGKSLQIVTPDGQTIPVEINGYTEEVQEEAVQQLDLQRGAQFINIM